jgi:VanZ family protein
VLIGVAAVVAGWRLAEWFRAWRASRSSISRLPAAPWFALLLLWLGVVFMLNWWPLHFSRHATDFSKDVEGLPLIGIRRMALAPFVEYYWGSKYEALQQWALKAFTFVPLGILLTLGPRGKVLRTKWQVFGCALAIAGMIQLGRYFLPTRTPSLTDSLIEAAGAVAAFSLSCYVLDLMGRDWVLSRRSA